MKDLILLLNLLKFSNSRIIEFIEEDKLFYLSDLLFNKSKQNYSYDFLNDQEQSKISNLIQSINLEKIKHRLSIFGIQYTTIFDKNYPESLREIFNPPAILFYKGDLSILDFPLAVVGSRKASDYGIWATRKIISQLKPYKLSIISGMALGIDRAAHEAALDNGIKTIGVLASSLDIQYPRSNMDLYQRMHDQLLISEHCLDVPALGKNFVLRNRIISGLSKGVLLIEAQERSGSLITAHFALDQGKEIFAIPGQIDSLNSRGTNILIKNGAKLVLEAKDIVDEFGFNEEVDRVTDRLNMSNLGETELMIIKILSENSLNANKLSNILDIKIEDLYKYLINLEVKLIIEKGSDGNYHLKI